MATRTVTGIITFPCTPKYRLEIGGVEIPVQVYAAIPPDTVFLAGTSDDGTVTEVRIERLDTDDEQAAERFHLTT